MWNTFASPTWQNLICRSPSMWTLWEILSRGSSAGSITFELHGNIAVTSHVWITETVVFQGIMRVGRRIFRTSHRQILSGCGKTMRVVCCKETGSVRTLKEKRVVPLEITDVKACFFVVTTKHACEILWHRLIVVSLTSFIEIFRPFNAENPIERAKFSVETQFSVVGVLEDMNTTLAVLEKYIPRFFTGASDIYFNKIDNFQSCNRNEFKPKVSEQVKNIVRQNFTREIEFYEFCRQRLKAQYAAVTGWK